MPLILTGIRALAQHLLELNINPEAYRPKRCPHCGCFGLWCHGYYNRHPDRTNSSGNTLNPIPIPRFKCPQGDCGGTCSVLPECIPPRRWYLWSTQQAALLLLLTGQLPVDQALPQGRTVRRWWARLKEHFLVHRLHLANHTAQLGGHDSVRGFWLACFESLQFSSAMLFIHQHHEVIP